MPSVVHRMSISHRVGWIALFAWFGPLAHAQRMPDPGQDLQLIESTERNEDPLGIDDSTGKELDHAAARLPKPKPVVILPTASQGATLSAIAGIRESEHALQVELAQGLAFVRARLRIVSTAKHAAELAYRFPLPSESVVTRLRVCAKGTCTDAAPDKARGPSALSGEPIEDAGGRAFALRVAPIAPGAMLDVELEYVASAPIRGGRVHLELPPRGYDPNLAPTQVRVTSARLRELVPGTELSVDAWTPLELSARVSTNVREETRAPCGAGSCTRSFEASAPIAAPARPTVFLIDASPSMEGPARGRVGVALAAVLGVLPEDTDVRAYAFAARASELGHFRADAAPLTQLSDATMLELDAASQPSSALALVDVARTRPRVLVLSDGLFDPSKREHEALLAARQRGAETWLLALGDVEPRLANAFSHVLMLGEVAETALRTGELETLEDALRAVAEKPLAGGAIAGEERVREQRPKADWRPTPGAPWLSFWMLRHALPLAFRLESSGADSFIAAVPYLSRPAPVAVADTGMPAQSVLSMLRDQLVPQARACLRADRKGRANYAVGLAFHALFAQREVYEARVEGQIPRDLRQCLESILPKLRVPLFSGRIRVRYPIHTEREQEAPAIELEPDVSRDLSRVFSPAPALP